jgi:hypothetical protein
MTDEDERELENDSPGYSRSIAISMRRSTRCISRRRRICYGCSG